MKKLLSLVLALCLALGLCAVSAQADAAQVQLTYWAPVNSALTSVISSLDDNLCMQLLQESTGELDAVKKLLVQIQRPVHIQQIKFFVL